MGGRCLCDQSPVKTMGTEMLMSFPHWSLHSVLEELTACVSPWFPPGFSTCTSPFADCAFAVFHQSCEYDCVPSPVSPPPGSAHLGVSQGPPNGKVKEQRSRFTLHRGCWRQNPKCEEAYRIKKTHSLQQRNYKENLKRGNL